jgi:hypothetical protein
MDLLKLGWVRWGPTAGWNSFEPVRGHYDFSQLVDAVKHTPNGARFILVIGGGRASWTTDALYVPARAAMLAAAVRSVPPHSIWAVDEPNEPMVDPASPRVNSPWLPAVATNNAAALGKWLVADLGAIGQAVKAVDPSVKIIGPGWQNFGYWDLMQAAHDAGIGGVIDAYSCHAYEKTSCYNPTNQCGPYAPLATRLAMFRSIHPRLPLLFTEYPINPNETQPEVAATVSAMRSNNVIALITNMALAGDTNWWASGWIGDPTQNTEGRPRPATQYYLDATQ